MVRIHSPRPILSITCKDWSTKQPTQLPTQFQSFCSEPVRLYCGHGEERSHPPSLSTAPAEQPASSSPSLAPVIDINVRHIGRKPQPQTLIGATAPEGWIKKIDRPREGKVWVGYFHLYVADSFGQTRTQEEGKDLGPPQCRSTRPSKSSPITSRSSRASSFIRETRSRALPISGRPSQP